MKIVYCVNALWAAGGIQTVTIQKANALCALGHDVTIAVSDGQTVNDQVKKLSPGVKLVNLGVNYYDHDWKPWYNIHRIGGAVIKPKKHKRRLKKLLNEIQPDVVIATGTSEKHFLPHLRISSNPVFVRELHFAKYYRHAYSSKGLWNRCKAYVADIVDYGWNIKNYDHVVVLTKEDLENNWRGWSNVSYMHNPLTIKPSGISTLESKKFISAGRLMSVKNQEAQVRAWKKVVAKHPDWTLDVWGQGLKKPLQDEIDRLGLQSSVFLKGHSYDIASEMQQCSGFLLTSFYEGFALVIVEAMACGLPVVSYSCPCGPKDIIEHGVNGYLCDVNDENKLAEYINLLIENEEKRKEMGRAAIRRSADFDLMTIARRWEALFKELIKNKKS